MIRAVVDTNVLVSGFIGFDQLQNMPGAVLRAWYAEIIDVVISEPILAEVRRTLDKPYFRSRLTSAQILRAQDLLNNRARLVPITVKVRGIATHSADDLVIATAVSAKADYLVTGDAALPRVGEYDGVKILNPRNFMEAVFASLSRMDHEP